MAGGLGAGARPGPALVEARARLARGEADAAVAVLGDVARLPRADQPGALVVIARARQAAGQPAEAEAAWVACADAADGARLPSAALACARAAASQARALGRVAAAAALLDRAERQARRVADAATLAALAADRCALAPADGPCEDAVAGALATGDATGLARARLALAAWRLRQGQGPAARALVEAAAAEPAGLTDEIRREIERLRQATGPG